MEDRADIRNYCLKLLARREYSQFELHQRLRLKGYVTEAIDEVLKTLGEQGWQSNERVREQVTHSRLQKGYGPRAIQHELRQKGVIDELPEVNWQSLIEQTYRRKFGANAPDSHEKYAKCTRFMVRHGFTLEQINRLYKQLRSS